MKEQCSNSLMSWGFFSIIAVNTAVTGTYNGE